ncbi:AAA family ATPase [Aquimarina sp. Aq78]|uniref:P-loop NTPase fold protein n=1 Tax=Aquimarina sp. Aq78 TaxID=1191889 RepID=UPI000D0F313C|nr:AAA family ATPase [Aquimarina sp. Aq78]
MTENTFPKFLSSKPTGEDKFAGGSHKKTAKIISETIRKESLEKRVIGLEGEWGSGKSNVIKIIQDELGKEYYTFIFDSWGNQEDLTRKSFLEQLISQLFKNNFLKDSKKWLKLENQLLWLRNTINMHFDFESLVLQCREERVLIDLSHQISLFHGQIGSGKSSLVRLIDYALGGNLEYTPAIRQELVSCTLNLRIGDNEAILERNIESGTNIRVTWSDSENKGATILAPIVKSNEAIWNENIFNLSDLLFYLLGMDYPMARKSKLQESTSMVRVSFREFMWYCYLDQDHLDSSFFRLEDTFKRNKSKDVLRYVVGYHSDELSKLESELYNTKDQINNTVSNISNLKKLLEKFDFDSAEDIEAKILRTNENLVEWKIKREKSEKNYKNETHVVDNLRENARKNISLLDQGISALNNLKTRVSEQTSLKNELLSSKFKLARSISIASVLDNVKFDLCPSCGSNISKRKVEIDQCYLCHSDLKETSNKNLTVDNLRLDIDSRIEELENSILIHNKELERQKKLIFKLENYKNVIDSRIDQELKNYDSRFLSNFREIDRKIATLEERLKGLSRIKKIPEEIDLLESNLVGFRKKEAKIKEKIDKEKQKFSKAKKIIKKLEKQFLETLIDIGFPGVTKKDKVEINKSSWNVYVLPEGRENRKWNFENAGSGGKKTLFNVAYLLSIHIVASNNNLPLPNFVIIDTPMKNIGEDVNEDIFDKFYNLLYRLSIDELINTKFIIVDKDFILPKFEVDLYERFMTPDDPNHPPLIPYYKGA